MNTASNYRTDRCIRNLGEKKITVLNHIPVFANTDDRKLAQKNVEENLYTVFAKYIKS